MLHLSLRKNHHQSQEGVLELLEAVPFSLKELKELTVNADVKVDLGRVFAGREKTF